MKSLRLSLLSLMLGATLILSCTDGGPVDLEITGPTATFAVVPVFPASAELTEALPINRIFVTVTTDPGGDVVLQQVFIVNPDAEEWELGLDIPVSDDPNQLYVVTVELVNNTDGVETVQWSGRTAPIVLGTGAAVATQEVEIVRGGTENLGITSVTVSGPDQVLEGRTFQVDARVTVDGSANPTVFWTSLTPEIASIDANGRATALRAGLARLQAEAGAFAAVQEVLVIGVPSGVVIDPTSAELAEVGEEITFEAVVVDGSGTPIPDEDVLFGVDDESVLEDLGDGTFRAIGNGAAIVTATSVNAPELSASANVVVELEVVELVIEPDAVTLTEIGQSEQLVAVGFDEIGTRIEALTARWSTSDSGVAVVDENGIVTAVGLGVATVTAEFGEEDVSGSSASAASFRSTVTAEATVTVSPGPVRLEIDPVEATLVSIGEEQVFTVTAFDLSDEVIEDPDLVFESSDPTVATVDANGVATALADGETTITVTSGEVVAEALLTVALEIATVIVAPDPAVVTPGLTTQLTAQALDANGNALDVTLNWASADDFFASVDGNGVVTGNHEGSVEITAFASNANSEMSGSATVDVVSAGDPASSSFTTVGNTELIGGAYPVPSTPHVTDPDNLLTGTPGLIINEVGPNLTEHGGTLTIEADGDFSYRPPIGVSSADIGTDSFVFSVLGGGSATATFVISELIWYVDNENASGEPSGAAWDPFGDVGGTVGGPGDAVYLHTGVRPYSGVTLQDDQALVGAGMALGTEAFNTIIPAGTRPSIVSAGNGVDVGLQNFVGGLNIDGAEGAGIFGANPVGFDLFEVSISGTTGPGIHFVNPTGTFGFIELSLADNGGNSFWVDGGAAVFDVDLSGAGIDNTSMGAVYIENTTGGSFDFEGGDVVDTGGWGVNVRTSGSDVTFNNVIEINGTLGNPGVLFDNSAGDLWITRLDAVQNGNPAVSANTNTGTLTILTGTIDQRDSNALFVNDTSIDITMSDVVVDNSVVNGGVSMFDAPGTMTLGLLQIDYGADQGAVQLSNSGTFNVQNPASYISNTGGGAAFRSLGTNLNVQFADVSSTGSGVNGAIIDLIAGTTGTFSVAGGSITGSADHSIYFEDTDLVFDFAGSIDNPATTSVQFFNVAGGTYEFTGPIVDTGEGIRIDGSAGTYRFTGGLDLNTGTFPGLVVSGSGTVEITGAGNTIRTTTGNAFDFTDTGIGPAGVTFESISANGSNIGINLVNTGTAGSFTLTGTGTAGSGGVIQNGTNDGVYLENTLDPAISGLDVDLAAGDGIELQLVDGVTLNGVRVTGSVDRAITGWNVDGAVTILNSSFDGGAGWNRFDQLDPGLSTTLTISNSTFSNNGQSSFLYVGDGGDHVATISDSNFLSGGLSSLQFSTTAGTYDIDLTNGEVSGSAADGLVIDATGGTSTIVLDGTRLDGNTDNGINVSASGTGVLDLFIANGTLIDSPGDYGVLANAFGGGQLRTSIRDSDVLNAGSGGVWLVSSGTSSVDARILDNTLDGGFSTGVRGRFGGTGTARMVVSGNTIRNTGAGVWAEAGNLAGDVVDVDFTITGNDLTNTSGIDAHAGGTATACYDISGNIGDQVRLNQLAATATLRLQRLNGGAGSVADPAVVAAHLETENPAAATWLVPTLSSTIDGVANGSCDFPTVPGSSNAAPAANPALWTTDAATPIDITLTGTDPDGDALTFAIVTPPVDGAVGTITPLGPISAQVTYTPSGGFPGDDPFRFSVSDGVNTREADVTVQILFPTAIDANYATLANTELVAGGFALPATPHIEDAANILDPTPAVVVTDTGTRPTTLGGSVTINADGSFSYTPPQDVLGQDDFTFDVTGGTTGTVTIDLTGPVVWYVDNTAAGVGTGLSNDPFRDLVEVTNENPDVGAAPPRGGGPAPAPPATAGEIIFLHAGDGTDTNHDTGITMAPGVILWGEAYGLNIAPYGDIVLPGSAPVISNRSRTAILLSSDNEIRGVDVNVTNGAVFENSGALGAATVDLINATSTTRGVRLSTTTGSIDFTNITMVTGTQPGFQITAGDPVVTYDGSIQGGAADLFNIQNTTGGSATFTTGPFTAGMDQLNASGMNVLNAAGTFQFDNMDVPGPAFRGVNIQASAGSFTFNDLDIAGTDSIAFNVTGGAPTVVANVAPTTIENSNHYAVQVENTTGGSVTMTGGNIVDTGGWGIRLQNNAGTVDIRNDVVVTNPDAFRHGILVTTGTGTVDFGTVTVSSNNGDQPAIEIANQTGVVTVDGGSVLATGERALDVSGSNVQLTFANTSSTGGAGQPAGVRILNTPTSSIDLGTVNLTSTDTGIPLDVTNGGNLFTTTGSVQSVGQTAIQVASTNLGATLSNVVSTASTSNGVDLQLSSGSLTITGGTINTTNSVGISLRDNSFTPFTYNGTVTHSGGNAVEATNNLTGTYNFGGQITVPPTGDGGVNLAGNTAGFFFFTGGIDVTASEGVGFRAVNGGQVNVTGANNVLDIQAAVALDIQNVTIGGLGVTFQTIDNDSNTAINLVNAPGAFTVTGTGAPGTGGTVTNAFATPINIQNFSGPVDITDFTVQRTSGTVTAAVNISNTTQAVTFDNLFVDNTVGRGLIASDVGDLSLLSGGFGTIGSATGDEGILINNTSGTVLLDNVQINGTQNHGVLMSQSGATGTLIVRNSTSIVNTGTGGIGGNAFDVRVATGGDLTATFSTVNLNSGGASGNGLRVQATQDAILGLTVDGATTTLAGDFAPGLLILGANTSTTDFAVRDIASDFGLFVDGQDTAVMRGTFDNVLVNGQSDFDGIAISQTGNPDMTLAITNSTVDNPAGPGIRASTSPVTGDSPLLDLTIAGNFVTQAFNGIRIVGQELANVCADIQGNTGLTNSPVDIDIAVSSGAPTMRFERLTPFASGVSDAALLARLLTDNPGTTRSASGGALYTGVPGGTCRTP